MQVWKHGNFMWFSETTVKEAPFSEIIAIFGVHVKSFNSYRNLFSWKIFLLVRYGTGPSWVVILNSRRVTVSRFIQFQDPIHMDVGNALPGARLSHFVSSKIFSNFKIRTVYRNLRKSQEPCRCHWLYRNRPESTVTPIDPYRNLLFFIVRRNSLNSTIIP